MNRSTIVTRCPSCSGDLQVTRLSCTGCATQLEGQFALPTLLRLAPDELAFVLAFVKASGSLKAMAQQRAQSYPTIRNMLNAIISKLDAPAEDRDAQRHAILDGIAKGEITTAEGARRLEEITR